MTQSMQEVADKLRVRAAVNPLSKETEFFLRNTNNHRVLLSIDANNGKARLQSNAVGGFHHVCELGDSSIVVEDEGVKITGGNGEFDVTLEIGTTGAVKVAISPR